MTVLVSTNRSIIPIDQLLSLRNSPRVSATAESESLGDFRYVQIGQLLIESVLACVCTFYLRRLRSILELQ